MLGTVRSFYYEHPYVFEVAASSYDAKEGPAVARLWLELAVGIPPMRTRAMSLIQTLSPSSKGYGGRLILTSRPAHVDEATYSCA